MPTGYTAMIEEDGNTNAREFVRKCAREFMPFIHQRDVDPLSAPPRLPDESWGGESEYRRKSVEDAKARLADVKGWTQAQAREEYGKYVAETDQRNQEWLKEYVQTSSRYQVVLGKLAKWEPHEEVTNLKKFCIEQIEMCMPEGAYMTPILTFDTWLQSEQQESERQVKLYEEMAEEERERYKGHRRLAQIFLDEIERVPE